MAINFPGGTQNGRAMIRAYKVAFTGSQESRAGVSGWGSFSGLNTLTHTVQNSGNIIICRLTCVAKGNAGTDSIQVRALRDGSVGHSSGVGLMNTSTGGSVREVGILATAAWGPDTNSHVYSWEWRAAESGSTITINETEEGNIRGQMLFELFEIEPDQTLGNGAYNTLV